ncbi:PREDICTED: uncharacterized protein LOC106891453 [Calidris pugnax]|uniref:uncharacterized protein LOC106891453 n=1 Tax=Calidris pugnax TaxID=198806 RepID=UPI00071D49ED|nr:PREDICTED: uncharacterized protein LOC106891453 [Calidris pugnax]XP_014803487.1 PREDICTED: uncharacterized protein LOC106891453 [Calidris pugnax]
MLTSTTDLPRFSGGHKSPKIAQACGSPMLLARSLPRELTKSDELAGDLEERDDTTPPPSSPEDSEHVLLTRDSPEDLSTKLSLCSDHSVQAFALPYLPFYRTSYVFISPSSLVASRISTETEESFNDGEVNTKHDEEASYSAVSTGYFPCYRTTEELLGQPLTYGLNTEEKKPDNDGKDESECGCAQDVGDAKKTIPPSLESDKKALSSVADEGSSAHQLLRDSTSELAPSTTSFSRGLPGLNQTFSSGGYFPTYRTEGELCPDLAVGDGFLTETEDLENKEGEQEGETSIWDLCAGCAVC